MSPTLILTATIVPPANVPALIRLDPVERLRDYLEAFRFYVSVPGKVLPHIVLGENSGSDLAPFQKIADELGGDKRVTLINLPVQTHPGNYGRGYGELKLLDQVLTTNPVMQNLAPETVVWKGTGRYRMLNIAKMIRTAPKSYDLYCDLRNRPFRWFDMRFFSFTLAGYRRLLLGKYEQLREDLDSSTPEIQLRRVIEPHLGEPGIIPRFRTEPHVVGVRGWDNRRYESPKNLAKQWIRAVSRKVTPHLWI